jgi:hypothetical protein
VYRTVETSFWSDPKIRRLTRDERLLFLYLVTNSHTHVSGIYYLPLAVVEVESGVKGKPLTKALQALDKARLAHFDREREVVFVRKMFKHQGKGDKNQRAAARQLSTLHGSPLIAEFTAEYPEVSKYIPSEALDRVSIGYPKLAVGTGTGTGTEEPTVPVSLGVPLAEENPQPSPKVVAEEMAWRVEQTWQAHLKARQAFFQRETGVAPSQPAIFDHDDIERPIRDALQRFDQDLLAPDRREEWLRESRVRAAGIGIFYDTWMAGNHAENNTASGGKRFLEPWRPWKPQKGKGHPVLRFAELYFNARDRAEASRAAS